MADKSNQMVSYLRQNPRMMGVLFTLLLLLSQAGSVAAGCAGYIYGP
ncbi:MULTISPECIES: DUF7503 family protein [Haloferax]|uniref:Uncharacterized protein n=1 Tax=Haloferax mediterranei (strain ATCC 33500 / DSM 1411 / JCM 8866 / NBRC 14739 / NCIMB 2177 / R-4) TaxID=523841 RepID=M0J612_HALMT|nr:hypothetical protein [Haloferax mediterranei]EMA03150.1 hypothetical protein C439_04110 [Haloferax mediterranei ATCC 33500]MDX5989083.1 hypothetical protein [Haloferax mediterranei ATCC 33500]